MKNIKIGDKVKLKTNVQKVREGLFRHYTDILIEDINLDPIREVLEIEDFTNQETKITTRILRLSGDVDILDWSGNVKAVKLRHLMIPIDSVYLDQQKQKKTNITNNSNNNMKNTITKNDVLHAACNLITKNGSTSTLEVKNELRNLGFFALQMEVSKAMDELATNDQEFVFSDNGLYRIYTPNVSVSTPASTTNALIIPSNVSTTAQITTSNAPQKTGQIGDWEVNSTTKTAVMYFSPSLSRDEVRKQYCQAQGVKWAETRARKIK